MVFRFCEFSLKFGVKITVVEDERPEQCIKGDKNQWSERTPRGGEYKWKEEARGINQLMSLSVVLIVLSLKINTQQHNSMMSFSTTI